MIANTSPYTKEFEELMNQPDDEFYSPKNKEIVIDQIIEMLKSDANLNVFYEISVNSMENAQVEINLTLHQIQSLETQEELLKENSSLLSIWSITNLYENLRLLNIEATIGKGL